MQKEEGYLFCSFSETQYENTNYQFTDTDVIPGSLVTKFADAQS